MKTHGGRPCQWQRCAGSDTATVETKGVGTRPHTRGQQQEQACL